MKFRLIIICLLFLLANTNAQEYLQKYYPETDALVLKQLEKWQDIKFGLLMHWGPYSQWGIVESWSICSEDEDWCRRKNPNYVEYVREYEELRKTFNPLKFNPDKWADAAKDAGMKYVVFTTKHHDGFCMFDTKQTNYKITDDETAFSKNSKANVTKEIFSSFRNNGFMIGAYFSKPDWHNENYWWKNFATPDRNVNYNISKYPERWKNFVDFTHNQIMELMSDYGRVDILWLDGGWVRIKTDEEVKEQMLNAKFAFKPQSQDLNMHLLVKKAREKQPGLIVVDRAVEGPYQNYLTPENQIPGKLLPYPWESCIIMGGGWSYEFNARYKTSEEVILMLLDIVSKGGNLLLNIAPSPEGTWDDEAYKTLKGVAEWMKINSEAIYYTRPIFPYQQENIFFTQNRFNKSIYLTLAFKKNTKLPDIISVPRNLISEKSIITVLGNNIKLDFQLTNENTLIKIPEDLTERIISKYAFVIKINQE